MGITKPILVIKYLIYGELDMKRRVLLLAMFLIGCGESDTHVGDSKGAAVSNCGVTQYESFTSEFKFHCGLNAREVGQIDDLSKTRLKKEQLCDVYYSENGQPKTFFCKEKPEYIASFIAEGASLDGDWACTGLDGFGGYRSKNESELIMYRNGSFDLLLKAKGKTDTDSVWYLTDSVINGNYEVGTKNKMVLTPASWSSELISKAGLKMDEAPEFMLVKPLTIEIKRLTKSSLEGISRWEKEPGRIVSSVECIKVIAK